MPYILGIDTGGTYTDGVLLDFERKTVVAKAKAFTTPGDLTLGIAECIANLGEINPQEIKMVSLSTTLATNAIVEGRGGKVGLILIGYRPDGKFPAQMLSVISGGHDGLGTAKCELDTQELARVIAQMKGEVDTLAISGIFSISNPEHENLAREFVRREWDVPIICAHELSSDIGLYERTVTACLNAKLLPIISDLLGAVKGVLKRKKIEVPLMVVKGDGSLISEEKALERPIETILSGPAASVVGAMFLADRDTFLTLDMGGTTTDIGIVKNSYWRRQEEGAIVAGWKTHIHTTGLSTFGIGGDSYLRVKAKGQLCLGPTRVIPLCVMGLRHPHLIRELREIQQSKAVNGTIFDGQTLDCWMIVKPPSDPESLSRDERLIVQELADGPHNVQWLKERIGNYVSPFALKSLEQARVIGRISFTPTDVLHCLGLLKKWNAEASLAGARILANSYGTKLENFAAKCLETMTQSITLAILQSIAAKQGYTFDIKDETLKFFLEPFFQEKHRNLDLCVPLGLNYPIVAIGAPVTAYLPEVGRLLRAEVIIPEHSEVASAVGAAMGKVAEKITALVKPGFKVHAPWGCEAFMYQEEACERILTKGKAIVLENAKKAGIINPEITVNRDKVISDTNFGPVFLEEFFEIIASGYRQEESEE
ncbi:hydantoinase/oxoprolinase family protein [Desulfosporosinus sp. PR]|uniref:hydantoinase/oxoprolinase family protein n=1 Tax=Candidatus Desulfosporosinus nitrosoreducens TaxID=3401928 RepID=UPI0027F7B11A|nr:hydantoinase/oxoprolinase family protein [Desulfosporosinus sp. PR]MDQ7093682.1 hydantoinase/oxoprolinase family protein [Desulfosporosinus sp. PR]